MFWVESRLRACTWDPAHGRPYVSAQLALSFGVKGGVGACFYSGAVQMKPGRLELWSRHVFIESSERKNCSSCSGFVKLVSFRRTGHRWSPHSGLTGVTFMISRSVFHKAGISGPFPTCSSASSSPRLISPSIPRGEWGKRGGFSGMPGATGSPRHPLTQTAGSALHTRIIRR